MGEKVEQIKNFCQSVILPIDYGKYNIIIEGRKRQRFELEYF